MKKTKTTTGRRIWLTILMIALIAVGAGLFLVIGVQVERMIQRDSRPAPATGFLHARFSFGDLAGRTLSPVESKPLGDIAGVRGLGIFNGVLYVSSWSDRAVYAVDPATGAGRQLADELNGVHDMIFDNGKIVAPVFNENRVIRIDPNSGRVSQLVAGLSGPSGIAKARDGGYYVTNTTGGTVVKISKDGKNIRTVASGLKQPAGIISDPDNILYVAQFGDPVNSVVQVLDDGQVRPLITGLNNAETLLRDDERNVIVGHVRDGHAALSFFKRGGTAVQPLLTTDLPGPMIGPVTDQKNLYFERAGGSTVYRIPLR